MAHERPLAAVLEHQLRDQLTRALALGVAAIVLLAGVLLEIEERKRPTGGAGRRRPVHELPAPALEHRALDQAARQVRVVRGEQAPAAEAYVECTIKTNGYEKII